MRMLFKLHRNSMSYGLIHRAGCYMSRVPQPVWGA